MRRRSILLDDELDRRIQRRARECGTTFSHVVREVLDANLERQKTEDGNLLLGLMRSVDRLGAPRPGERVDLDSPEGKRHAARDIYRHDMNREPDW